MDDREQPHEPVDDGFGAPQHDPAGFGSEAFPPAFDPASETPAGSDPGAFPEDTPQPGSYGPDGGIPEDPQQAGDFLDLGTQFAAAPAPAPTGIEEPAPQVDYAPDPTAMGAPGAQEVPVEGEVAGELIDGVEFDVEDDEGSWLMSLDDVLGDRAGSDGIVHAGSDSAELPPQQDASWSEETTPKAGARRALVPMLAVLVASMVGWAGWRFVDMRGELTTRAPGPLDAGSAPQPRRVVPLDGATETVGPNTRQSVGKGPQGRGPKAGPGPQRNLRPMANPRLAYRSTLPPAPTLAPGVPHPIEAPELTLADAGSVSSVPEPVVAAGASGAAPAPIPTTLPDATATVADAEPSDATVGLEPTETEALAVSEDTRSRWQRMFGVGSDTDRDRRPAPRAQGDQRIIASSTEGVTGSDGVEVASILPYGLDSAYVEGWSPPIGEYEEEIDPSELPVEYVRSAGWRDLTGLWVGTEVPYAAIDKEDRMLTPGIGFVAVYLQGGEVVEGILTEVGGGHVWVQTSAAGRMGLRHETIKEIDVIGLEGLNGNIVVESLSRVRVATAGGAVYGRLVTSNADRATVYTDAGARITVPRGQVEFLGSDAAVRLNRG